jgi:hypothetical protein
MANLNLNVVTTANALIAGNGNSTGVAPSSLPLFCPDTGTVLNVYLWTPIIPAPAGGVFPYVPVSTAGITLYFYLNDGTVNGTIYASCISFTPVTDATGTYFTGSLALNTAALEALFAGGEDSVTVTMMIGYVFAGLQATIFNGEVQVTAGIPTNVVAPVPAGETALSQQQAANTYVPIEGPAGQPIVLTSKNGKQWVLQVVDNADGTSKFQASPVA